MISLQNCTKIYDNGVIGIKDINIELPSMGLIGIVGESGSGKSTLINCIGGLDNFSCGTIIMNGKSVVSLSKYSNYIFQENKLFEELTVYENITFSCSIESIAFNDVVDRLGIRDILDSRVNLISGGQRQRVAIARALVRDVSIVICDEPTANLDEKNSIEVLSLLEEISNNKLVIIVSHQVSDLEKYADEVLYIADGTVNRKQNIINYESNVNYKTIEETSISNRWALKFGIKNMKYNKVKSMMTVLFLFLSLTALSLLTTFLSIDLNELSYKSYKNNNMQYVKFTGGYDDEGMLVKGMSITNYGLSIFEPEIISYDNINFEISYNDNIEYFNAVWVSKDNTFLGKALNDDEAIVSRTFAEMVSFPAENVINTYLISSNDTIKIVGIIENEDYNLMIINNNTYLKHNANVRVRSYMKIKRSNESYSTEPIYCSLLENQNINIIEGMIPNSQNEICLALGLLNQLFPNENNFDYIGKTVKFEVFVNGQFSILEDAQITHELEFIVSGYTNQGIIFDNNETENIIFKYGSSRIDAGLRGAIIYGYKLNTFASASKVNMYHEGELSDNIYFIYNMIRGFHWILITLSVIFFVITIVTLINSISSSILKSKKDLGVMIAFKIKRRSLNKIFIFEGLLLGLIALLLSIVVYIIGIFVINSQINLQWNMNILVLTFNVFVVITMIAVPIIVIGISAIFPLRKLMKQRPIDIIYER